MIRLHVLVLLCYAFTTTAQTGYLDPTFGNNGTVVTPIRLGTFDFMYDMLIQPDEKIVYAGAGNGVVMIRYMPDCELT